MKPAILLLLISVLVFSCSNSEKKAPPPAPSSHEIIQTLPPIPQDDIIAEWQNPHIIVYNSIYGGCRYHCTYIRFYDGPNVCDTTLFGDGMIAVDSVHIDTLRLSDGKYPEVVFKWYARGSHSYGQNWGGWGMETHGIDIWDVNNFNPIFSEKTYEHSTGATRNYESESEDDDEEFDINESYTTTTIRLDSVQKVFTLTTELDSGKRRIETYRYKNRTFVLDK